MKTMKFTQPNIDAIAAGRKTQTRRPIKPQPPAENYGVEVLDRYRKMMACYRPFAGGTARWGLCEVPYQPGELVRVATPDGEVTQPALVIEITGVRCERLQQISESDCGAEGCPGWYSPCHPDFGQTDGCLPSEEFEALWRTIYGPAHEFEWHRNPWVFVYEFRCES